MRKNQFFLELGKKISPLSTENINVCVCVTEREREREGDGRIVKDSWYILWENSIRS